MRINDADAPRGGAKPIPPAVRARLPRYYRILRGLIGCDILRTSSGELSMLMRLTQSQIRQDFSYIGSAGEKGYGYNVKELYSRIGAVIGIPENLNAVIVAASGDFAKALSADACFSSRGVNLKMIFSDDLGDFGIQEQCGSPDSTGLPSYRRACAYCAENRADIAVLACEKRFARDAAAELADAGVRGIWNFTGTDLFPRPGDNTKILNMNLPDILLGLCCEITNQYDGKPTGRTNTKDDHK